MSAVSKAPLMAAAAGSLAAFGAANAYVSCLLTLPGSLMGNLTPALEALPTFIAHNGILHGGAAPLASGLVAACGVWALWAYSLTHGRADRAGEEHGSARWAKPSETRKFADARHPENNVILSRDVRMALDAKEAHIDSLWQRNLNRAVVGGSGSGKTFFDLLPNIMQANASYFVTDPKGQTLPMAGGLLAERGYRVLAFDTIDFSKSLHYNPIAYVEDEADILELVGCLIANTSGDDRHAADPFWENAERLLYVALIGYLVKHCPREDRSLSGVVTLLSLARAKETDEDYVSPLDLLFLEVETGMRYMEVDTAADAEADPLSRTASAGNARFRWVRVADPVAVEDDFCLLHYKMFKDAAGRTAKSILVSCNTRMEPFAIPQVRELVSYDEMELDRLGDSDCRRAVFAIVSDTSGLYSFLLAIMMWQAVNVLCRRALTRYGGALPTHVSFLLDEFANIGRLPDIEKTIAVVRSRNVSMTVYLQSMSQLKSRYKDDAATIVDCCDTTVFLGGKSTDTVREISEAVGKETVGTLTWNETRGSTGSSTRNWNTVERDLVQPSEVARLPRDEAVVLISGAFPVRDKKYDPRRHPMWARVASGDAGAPAPFDFTEYRARLRGGGAEAKDGARTDVRGRRPAEDGHPSRADARRKEG